MHEIPVRTFLTLIPEEVSRKVVGEFVPVFMLHRIIDSNGEVDLVRVKQLHAYLAYIRKNNYQPIGLENLFIRMANGEPLPRKSVAFSVDDGFEDQFEYLAPIFSQYDVPLTCFVITGLLDGILWPWDDQINHIVTTTKLKSFTVRLPDGSMFTFSLDENCAVNMTETITAKLKNQDQTHLYNWLQSFYNEAEVEIPSQPPFRYKAASWEQAKKFIRSGHSIAAHTKTHRILSRLNESEAEDEIIGSYRYLKSKITESANIFAYPTGRPIDFGVREEKIVMESPMIGAVSAVPDAVRNGYKLEALPRFGLPDTMGDFLQYLSFIEVLKNKLRKIDPIT